MGYEDIQICPSADAGTCTIYRNWSEKARDERVNVIIKSAGRYGCLALMALEDSCSEGGVEFTEETRKKINDTGVKRNLGIRETGCYNITLLNLLNDLRK